MRTVRTDRAPFLRSADGSRFARLGFYCFLAALALAPLLGGTPSGPDYALATWGGDGMSGLLRALVLVAALLAATLGATVPTRPGVTAMIARYGVYGASFWVVVSALIHSRFFTSPVYLFAMLPEVLNWLVYAVAFAAAARFAARDRADIPRMATALLVGGALCAVIGIVAYGTVPGAERIAHRESATFFSPNFAAGFCAVVIPLAVARFLVSEGVLASVVAAAGTGLLFSLLMITGSRAGLVLTLAGLAVALVLSLVRKAQLPWVRVGVIVGVIALSGVAFNAPMLGRVRTGGDGKVAATTVSSRGGAESSDHSGEFRKETWRGTLAMASENAVLGAGPGTYPYTYSRYAVVGWTGQAHSSYLQIAGESGFPALLLLLMGIGGVLVIGLTHGSAGEAAGPVILSALVGSVIASLGRSVFDSEWMLLGCGVPFFAVLGMIVGAGETTADEDKVPSEGVPRTAVTRFGYPVFLAAALLLTLFVRNGQVERDMLVVSSRTNPGSVSPLAKAAAERVLPADPQIYALAGDYATAAYLSPSGKRFFQLARASEREGDWDRAVDRYKRAADADPNNLQTRKALAEAQEKMGDAAGAVFTYLDMTKIAEGPAGKIRAIPELVDTIPAFAYAALGEDALQRGEADEALRNFEKARAIVEAYSRTTPQYQLTELATLGANAASRRSEVRSLYTDRIVPGYRAALRRLGRPVPAALDESVKETVARLDAFMTQPGPPPGPT